MTQHFATFCFPHRWNNFGSWAGDDDYVPTKSLELLSKLKQLRYLNFSVHWAYDAPRDMQKNGLILDMQSLAACCKLEKLEITLPERCQVRGEDKVRSSCKRLTSLKVHKDEVDLSESEEEGQ